MIILGISCYYHDSAAALIKDGRLIGAVEEERFSRKKHDSGFPHLAIKYCLSEAGINAQDIDFVVFYEKPLLKFERILMTALGTYPKSWKSFSESMISWLGDKLWIKQTIAEELDIKKEKVQFVDHHLSHSASAFFASPYEKASIVTIDGVGEWATATIGSGHSMPNGDGNILEINREQEFPHSIGLLYSAFTSFLGFRVNSGEYKVMGMSPYGDPKHIEKIERIFKISDDGSFWMDMDFFSFNHSAEHSFNKNFVKLFGKPRKHETEFFTERTNPNSVLDLEKAKENQHYADIAASIQKVTEKAILAIINASYDGTKNLCMAGGVALNSKANGRILRETPFEHLFIQPAAGDSGGALGAALYWYHVELGKPRKFIQDHCYWGPKYSLDQISSAIKNSDFIAEEFTDKSKIVPIVAKDIVDGKVISLFQGRVEWGPRALGNRSILADPRREEMKEIVNRVIKFREPFRPFAPVILSEDASRFFPDLASDKLGLPQRFMQVVQPWEPNFGEKVPAVNHLGTGRMQTIQHDQNPFYYDLVNTFGEITDVPVLMNTSFNLRGEPIVNTPENALNTFAKSGIDTLVMENFVIRKNSSDR